MPDLIPVDQWRDHYRERQNRSAWAFGNPTGLQCGEPLTMLQQHELGLDTTQGPLTCTLELRSINDASHDGDNHQALCVCKLGHWHQDVPRMTDGSWPVTIDD